MRGIVDVSTVTKIAFNEGHILIIPFYLHDEAPGFPRLSYHLQILTSGNLVVVHTSPALLLGLHSLRVKSLLLVLELLSFLAFVDD